MGSGALRSWAREAAEGAAVDQEENAAGAGVGDETPGEIAGGEGLSAAHGHVDQSAGVIASERLFQVDDDGSQRPARGKGGMMRRRPRRVEPGDLMIGYGRRVRKGW